MSTLIIHIPDDEDKTILGQVKETIKSVLVEEEPEARPASPQSENYTHLDYYSTPSGRVELRVHKAASTEQRNKIRDYFHNIASSDGGKDFIHMGTLVTPFGDVHLTSDISLAPHLRTEIFRLLQQLPSDIGIHHTT